MEHSDSSFAKYADLKLKSAHFSISFIKIGFWQKHSHFGGNLIGKFHYNWQKIMWEIVENGVKNRIVIPWNRICGIRASRPQICRSIIELELDHPPDFEIEKVSQSRKREKPEPVPDFTQEQASCCRRHWIEVPEEDFDKHYEKILLSLAITEPPIDSPLQDHMEVGGTTNEDQTQEGLKISLRTCFSTEEIEKFLLEDNVDHAFTLPEQYKMEHNTLDSTASIGGAQSSEFSGSWLPQPATSALSDKEVHESWSNFLGSESPCQTLLDDPHVHDSMGGDWSF
ncbi:hypothetical protein QJS04_geneDACA007093 [Acorus gramineus]|uniref:TRF2/HOY1 PH-like domain-containing protein n=1 Tax=Acorus gramineus TaxID=55184 RepID=A0AAV9BQ51_ACOGR|nr:hypothetical protein QJS04_geneDACA007093 [Acorus gramineus]